MSTPQETLELSGSVELTAKEGKLATVSILAYSGGVMSPPGWGPVVIDLNGLDMAASFPLLVDHDASLNGVLGTGSAKVANGKLYATGQISKATDAAQRVIQLSKDGFKFQASVGVSPTDVQRIRAGETIQANGRIHEAPSNGLAFVKAGKLKEITVTALGADDSTEVNIAARREQTMSAPTNTTEPNHDDIRAQERDRIKRIEAACGNHNWGANAHQVDELKAKAIDGDMSFETLQANLLDILRNSRPKPPHGLREGDGEDISAKHVEAAILLKYGYEKIALKTYGDRVTNQASDLQRAHILDIAATCLKLEGRDKPRDRGEMVRAAVSTTTLPQALSNTMGRVLEMVYRETPATWRSFCSIRSADNFKDQTSIRPSFMEEPDQVGSDGKLSHSELSESYFTWSVDTYGKVFSVSRRDMVNDRLGFFDEIGPGLARASLRKLNDLVWDTIMSDATHFTSGRSNYQDGAGSALSATSLETAIKQMRKQRNDSGDDLDIQPSTLVVGPSNEVTARQILESTEIQAAEGEGMGNPLSSIVSLEVESRLENTDKFSGASTTQWYLWAAPMDVPAVVGFLNGVQTPTVEFFGLDHDADTLAMKWRCYQDFGFALGDYHAGQKSKGAA